MGSGSKYASDSIWNNYGNFGGRYSNQSPWNSYASDAPVFVDDDGNLYGYLTANRYNPQRTNIKLYVTLTDLSEVNTNDPESVADRLCVAGSKGTQQRAEFLTGSGVKLSLCKSDPNALLSHRALSLPVRSAYVLRRPLKLPIVPTDIFSTAPPWSPRLSCHRTRTFRRRAATSTRNGTACANPCDDRTKREKFSQRLHIGPRIRPPRRNTTRSQMTRNS